jgi:DNA helicase-2/ATP-dependent DNA helicase PcrA
VSNEAVLDRLNAEQRRAVECVHGPVCILAGAGSGKTTTITRRIAYQVVSGEFEPKNILAVTFTTKAAGELMARLERLGAAGVPAKTFHAAALSQLTVLGGRDYDVLPSKIRIVREAAQVLPAEYRSRPLPDLAQEIERAKNRRVPPERYAAEMRDAPLPVGLMAKVYDRYEKLKIAAGKVDFEDLLEHAIAMYETDDRARARFNARYRAVTVDEYQDVNLLQQTLLERWLDGRDELCVVGDDYQAIYSFTGATPSYLLEMPSRYPNAAVIRLERNYRSTAQVLELANKLVLRLGGASKRLIAADGATGPMPKLCPCEGLAGELETLVAEIRRLATNGVPYEQMAVLYRINYRSADYEEALHQARIPFQVVGGGFLERPAARAALRQIRGIASTGVTSVVEQLLESEQFIAEPDPGELSPAELTRQQDLARLRDLASEFDDGERSVSDFLAHLRERFDSEQPRQAVRLMTYHSAKGLEFEAVFLQRVEQRELPFYRALDAGTVTEERRLFYVGLTRAKKHLLITWDRNRKRSKFLDELDPQDDQPARRRRGRRDEPPKPTDQGKRPGSRLTLTSRAEALAVVCPKCGAMADERCVGRAGPRQACHIERHQLAVKLSAKPQKR